MKPIILIAEDDTRLLAGIKFSIEMAGYQTLTASDGEEALSLLQRTTPDLIIADIMMPRLDGFGLYERVRADTRWISVPFIFLTARSDLATIARGKDLGADDYITKPFSTDELLASIRGRLRRASQLAGHSPQPTVPPSPIKIGDVVIDAPGHRVMRGGRPIKLTPTEFNLLLCLARRAGQVLSPEEIGRDIFYKDEYVLLEAEERVRVHIKNLRHKLEPNPATPRYIQNVRGVGYVLVAA